MRRLLSIVFLVDIFLQSYFRRIGFGTMNQGISFGWWPNISLWVIVGVLLLLIVWARGESDKRETSLPLLALILGGLGNLIPRLWLGSVWDYIYFPVLGFWFNLADALISFGIISYILEGDGNPSTL